MTQQYVVVAQCKPRGHSWHYSTYIMTPTLADSHEVALRMFDLIGAFDYVYKAMEARDMRPAAYKLSAAAESYDVAVKKANFGGEANSYQALTGGVIAKQRELWGSELLKGGVKEGIHRRSERQLPQTILGLSDRGHRLQGTRRDALLGMQQEVAQQASLPNKGYAQADA